MHSRTSRAVLLSGGVCCVIAALGRIFIGVDFTDEGIYLAIPYRFALGDMPFRDELLLQQTAGFLLVSIVKSFLWLNGGTEGIILASRILFFLAALSVGAFVRQVTRPTFGRYGSSLAAVLCVIATPRGIPNFSYNTFAHLLLIISLFSRWHVASSVSKSPRFFLIAILDVLLVWCYPTLIISVLVSNVIALPSLLRASSKVMFAYTGGLLVGAIPFAVLIGIVGVDSIENTLQYTLTASAEPRVGIEKLQKVAVQTKSVLWTKVIPELMGANPHISPTDLIIIILSVLFPLLIWITPVSEYKSLGTIVWIPSILSGLIAALTSASGVPTFAVGATPAALVSLLCLSKKTAGIIFAGIIECYLASVPFFWIYRDLSLSKDLVQVTAGPYAGLWTSAWRKEASDQLLAASMNPKNTVSHVLFYPRCAGCYLFSSSKPAAGTVWVKTGSVAASDTYRKNIEQAQDDDLLFYQMNVSFDGAQESPRLYKKDDPIIFAFQAWSNDNSDSNRFFTLRRAPLGK